LHSPLIDCNEQLDQRRSDTLDACLEPGAERDGIGQNPRFGALGEEGRGHTKNTGGFHRGRSLYNWRRRLGIALTVRNRFLEFINLSGKTAEAGSPLGTGRELPHRLNAVDASLGQFQFGSSSADLRGNGRAEPRWRFRQLCLKIVQSSLCRLDFGIRRGFSAVYIGDNGTRRSSGGVCSLAALLGIQVRLRSRGFKRKLEPIALPPLIVCAKQSFLRLGHQLRLNRLMPIPTDHVAEVTDY